MRWSGWRPTGNGRITTRGRVARISSMSFARDGSSFWRWASGSPALSRTCTPSARVARSASAARVVASPRVPVSPWVKSMIPTRWPARTALASVPPQVSSTSSRWAAIARRSTRWEVTPRVRMWNAECGVRNEPSERRTPWPAVRIGLSASIPHSAFRTPHWCSFVPQRLNGVEPGGSRRRGDPEDEPDRDRHDRRDRGAPHRHGGAEVEQTLEELPGTDSQDDAEDAAHQGQRRRLHEELPKDIAARRAHRLAQADLRRPARHRHHHDRHHPDAPHQERDARQDEHHEEERERQAVEDAEHLVGR